MFERACIAPQGQSREYARTTRRSLRISVALLLATSLLISCSSSDTPVPPVPSTTSAALAPEFVVAIGADGLALAGTDWLARVDGIEPAESDPRGQLVAGIDAARAAVVYADHIAVVQQHRPAIIADCVDCVGVAVTDRFIVTSRRNFTPGNGFDLVLFEHDLSTSRAVPAQRLEERATTDYPAENDESPITLAADEERITVGYVARDGGYRRGPSIIAQYAFDGRLLASTKIMGLLGRSAVSPDGRRLAVGAGGSSGYCHTHYAPVMIDLGSLRVQPVEPAVPQVDSDTADPWFFLTDLQWAADKLIATGELHNPPENDICDPEPQIWQRTVDPTTGAPVDSGDHRAIFARWIGPGCDDVLTVGGNYPDRVLSRGSGERLGRYHRIGLGRPAPAGCPQP
ncbi:hypothetical protein GCM10011608_51670 [Micromonospora sonchi]|uniref:Uncharacterized protein n=1 Tax=Micromonospora sonchi TaxID=1763543 RepID=A0A917X382_9ACTN|nr:hypothetical protein [Micromonospora sonchi]GGM60289.1 hypothetical protein GCM10011608_51670 [Micromonospora sonchi]